MTRSVESVVISQVGDSIADYCVFLTGGGTRGTTYDFVAAYEKSDLAKEAIRLVAEVPILLTLVN
jgi:hypothetical protein